jgi:hypothetical protein
VTVPSKGEPSPLKGNPARATIQCCRSCNSICHRVYHLLKNRPFPGPPVCYVSNGQTSMTQTKHSESVPQSAKIRGGGEPRNPVGVRFVKAPQPFFQPRAVSVRRHAKAALNHRLASFFRFDFPRPKRRSFQLASSLFHRRAANANCVEHNGKTPPATHRSGDYLRTRSPIEPLGTI